MIKYEARLAELQVEALYSTLFKKVGYILRKHHMLPYPYALYPSTPSVIVSLGIGF